MSEEKDEERGTLSTLATMIKKRLECEGAVVIIRTKDGDLGLGTAGMPPHAVPPMLRFVARFIKQRATGQPMAGVVVQARDVVNAGRCPSCDMDLMFPQKIFDPMHARKAVVCQCGSFLTPIIEGTAVTVRLMTIDEVADLPDDVRNEMLQARRVAAQREEDDDE